MYKHSLMLGQLQFEVNAWSPNDASRYYLRSWSLKPIQEHDDALKHRELASGLCATLHSIGAKMAYAPNVAAMSATIVRVGKLGKQIPLGDGVVLHRDKDVPADGVFLPPGKAFMMSGAGCPLIIATAGEYAVVAHAGRDSLIDRGAVMGRPTRNCGSVVDSIIDALLGRNAPADDIDMCMLFAIPAESFGHPENDPRYGEFNSRLGVYAHNNWPGSVTKKDGSVFVDLGALFVEQARQRGVRRAWAVHSLDEYPDLAHTRDGKDISRRNLYVVKRNT